MFFWPKIVELRNKECTAFISSRWQKFYEDWYSVLHIILWIAILKSNEKKIGLKILLKIAPAITQIIKAPINNPQSTS